MATKGGGAIRADNEVRFYRQVTLKLAFVVRFVLF